MVRQGEAQLTNEQRYMLGWKHLDREPFNLGTNETVYWIQDGEWYRIVKGVENWESGMKVDGFPCFRASSLIY